MTATLEVNREEDELTEKMEWAPGQVGALGTKGSWGKRGLRSRDDEEGEEEAALVVVQGKTQMCAQWSGRGNR